MTFARSGTLDGDQVIIRDCILIARNDRPSVEVGMWATTRIAMSGCVILDGQRRDRLPGLWSRPRLRRFAPLVARMQLGREIARALP